VLVPPPPHGAVPPCAPRRRPAVLCPPLLRRAPAALPHAVGYLPRVPRCPPAGSGLILIYPSSATAASSLTAAASHTRAWRRSALLSRTYMCVYIMIVLV